MFSYSNDLIIIFLLNNHVKFHELPIFFNIKGDNCVYWVTAYFTIESNVKHRIIFKHLLAKCIKVCFCFFLN